LCEIIDFGNGQLRMSTSEEKLWVVVVAEVVVVVVVADVIVGR